MKNTIRVTAVLGTAVMGLSVSGVGIANAATTNPTGGETTATVGLEKDDTKPIELTTAPDFEFGSKKLDGTAITMNSTKVTDPITVINPGLDTGWNVTVSGSDFTTADGTLTLKGALLTLNGVVTPGSEGNVSGAPTTGSVGINGSDQKIFTAEAGNGIGTWLNKFTAGDTSAVLTIPDGNQAGEYKADLTWTLQNAPG